MAKNLEISYLMDIYGECLTEKQRSFIEFYYDDDLSLSEIAENENITRQGVRDAIKRAENTLLDLESKLGFAKKYAELDKCLDDISECADKIYDFNLTTNVSKDINDNVAKIKALCEYLNRM
ncbi:YlxM family DNA-binding protein [Eubacterium sp.]|uniref:YlxM family DNA-binding protein n=1 Tax=Eubacterium sp. TaxID=142586 RepID=UPI0015B85889|nr:YlxM family DNA-binding protein [uncultured Eubacterium sp.]